MAEAAVRIPITVPGLDQVQKLERRMEALEKEVTRLQKKMPQAANSVRKFGRASQGAAAGVGVLDKSLKGLLVSFAPLLTAVAGLTTGFRTLVNQDFAEAKVRTLGVNSQELVKNLKQVSNELQGQRSVVELTAASYDVASAGFASATEASQILKAASQGATGGFSDLNTVANATTSVLNAYGLAASDAQKLVDQFIQTQNDGKIVVAEYASEIGKVAAVAAALNVPLSEVNAVIALATASGVKAEVAFTGLKTALAQLASGDASKRLKGLGLDINAATIEADGLVGTFKKIKESGADTGEVLKLLGTEAGPALQPVINQFEKFLKLVEKQENAIGAAKEAQLEAANTIQGALKSVSTAFSNLFSEQSELAGPLIVILKGLAAAINAINSPLGKVVLKIGLAVVAFKAVALVIAGVTSAIAFLKATALASWFGPVIQQLALGNTAFAGFILKTKAAAVAVKGLKIAMVALKVAMLALPVAIVVGGLLAINKLLRKNADDASAMGRAIADASLIQATESLERVQKEQPKREAAVELNSKRLEQERQIEQVLRGQLSAVVSREALEQKSLNAAKSKLDNQNTLMNARFGLFMKLNELEIQRAKNAGDTNKQYQLQVQQADLVYQKSLLQIKADVKKAEMAALQVKIEFKKLEAATKLKAAKGEVMQADLEALALQKQAVQLSLEGVKTAQLAANYNTQTASAIRQMTVEQLKFNSAQRAGASISGGGGGGASSGGGNLKIMGTAGTRSIGSATPQSLFRDLSAAGATGTFTENQAVQYLQNIQRKRVDAFKKATKGTTAFTSMPSSRVLEGYAKGGYVTSPTNALVGEGGESEYVVPSSKMEAAVRRYSAGARGSAVIPGGNDAAAGGGGGGASYSTENNAYVGGGSNQINVTTGPVMKMNGQNYVSMGDLQRGLSEAVSAVEVNMSSRMRRSYAARRSMGL